MLHTLNRLFSQRILFLYLSIAFTTGLIIVRVLLTGKLFGLFLIWNLFLASVPLFLAYWLQNIRKDNGNIIFQAILFALWLLFFPNAMYIVTDLFHLKTRWPVPLWYDTILLFSAAWNGILLGFKSLTIVQRILETMVSKMISAVATTAFLFLAGYGIFLGRYLRWNSWDIVSNPFSLIGDVAGHILYPRQNVFMYGFVFLLGCFLSLAYFILQPNLDAVKPARES